MLKIKFVQNVVHLLLKESLNLEKHFMDARIFLNANI